MPDKNPDVRREASRLITERPNGRIRVQTVNDHPSVTVEGEEMLADMNYILSTYKETGVLWSMGKVDLEYRDAGEFTDFSDMMQQIKAAEMKFLELPPQVREVFDNDVANWLDAAHDADKFDALRPKLEELGVIDRMTAPATPESPAKGPEPSPPIPTED